MDRNIAGIDLRQTMAHFVREIYPDSNSLGANVHECARWSCIHYLRLVKGWTHSLQFPQSLVAWGPGWLEVHETIPQTDSEGLLKRA